MRCGARFGRAQYRLFSHTLLFNAHTSRHAPPRAHAPAEVNDYEEQLKELIAKIQSSLENDLPNLTGQARMDVRRGAAACARRGAHRPSHRPGGGGVPLRRARTQKCNFIKGRIDRVRQVYHSYKVELRELPKSEAREYEVVRRRVGAPRAPPPPPSLAARV